MHKPVFNTDLEIKGNFLSDRYNNYSEEIINKWHPILETGIDDVKLNDEDTKLMCFYIEWMSLFDTSTTVPSTLIDNVHSLISEMFKLSDSDSFNFKIINKVYNPFFKRERFLVEKDGDEVVMDETYMRDKAMLIDLYPTEFFIAIGETGMIRERNLESILDEG